MRFSKGFFNGIQVRFKRNKLGELLVQRGKITPEQLRNALCVQKETEQNLGSVLQDLYGVSKTSIRTSLFEQTAYRTMAASVTVLIGLSAFGMGSTVKANPYNTKSQFQQTAMVHKASYNPRVNQIRPMKSHPRLFGSREVASSDISAFTKWTGILGRLDKVSFQEDRASMFQGLALEDKVEAVNDYVNKVTYIEDKNNFGKSDYWATPSEFFARGGDCEDFAIAKYALLKQLGVPESRMRLAIVQDKIKNIPHAVLIVYTDKGAKLLDNQIKEAQPVTRVSRYKPIYSINADGWWRHLS